MPELQPFDVDAGGPADYLAALRRALDGSGPTLLPYAGGPLPALPDHDAERLPDGVALVVSTSGSTGEPKRAMLTAAALTASADATHARLGGPGGWLLAMPAQHIAGTQVLIRSLRSGTAPMCLPRFTVDLFAEAAHRVPGPRKYTALVPTQLVRILRSAPAREALAGFDAVLLGGAASDPGLLQEAREHGVRIATTYGSSETAGGCVYDGVPLAGTEVMLAEDGRVTLGGPTIAAGYLGRPRLTEKTFGRTAAGTPTFRTDDIGQWQDGRLQILGRVDDLITTGGLKVAPRVVEAAVLRLPQVRECVALALPDPQWGQLVAVALCGTSGWDVRELRAALRAELPSYALPRAVLTVAELPLRGPGKPDRGALARSSGWQRLD